MIKLTWRQLREQQFSEVFNRLLQAKMSFQTARRFQKITEVIQSEQRKLNELWPGLVEKYLEQAPGSGGAMLMLKPELDEETKTQGIKEIEEFQDTIVEIGVEPILLSELGNFLISPMELNLIKGLVDVDGN